MQRPYYAIIPSRYASSRLPGKPLADLGGKPLFWHVFRRVSACPIIHGVWLATDDERIENAAKALQVPCVRTRADHPSGTDRTREAVHLLNLPEEAVIVNIQGDEPFISPDMIQALLSPFQDKNTETATLGTLLDPVHDAALIQSPNQVKIALAANGNALYFSRAAIPFARDGNPKAPFVGHIGMYAFRRDILERMASLTPSPLEETEKLEQLRLLENGISMKVTLTEQRPHGVDTPEDLEAARVWLSLHPEFLE